MDEFALIERIVRGLGQRSGAPWIVVGPGDDAAVVHVEPGAQVVSSIDALLPGVHFPYQAPPELIGYRAVMVSVSDLAAMAALPRYVLVGLSLQEQNAAWVDALVQGMAEAASDCHVAICGGNLARGPLNMTISVHGEVPKGGAILRSGASVGDLIQVSGPLGGAAACVRNQAFAIAGELTAQQHAYYRPRARLDLVDLLRAQASAAIDVSDGLAQDLGHVLDASALGAELSAADVPIAEGASLEDALFGGDDYELIATGPTEIAGFQPIGRIVQESGIRIDGRRLEPTGYDHFEG